MVSVSHSEANMKTYYLATDHSNTASFFITEHGDMVDTRDGDPDVKYEIIVDGFFVGSLDEMRQAALEKFKAAKKHSAKMSKLASLVAEKEAEFAYGSETCILTGFVNTFGFVEDALRSDAMIGADVLEAFRDAYSKLERLNKQGNTDFVVGDLF